MKKRDIVRQIAERTGSTLVEAEHAYDTLWGALIDDFADTGVMKTPVANFYVKDRQERTYTIPSGDKVTVPAGKRVQASVKKILKDIAEDHELAA